MATDAFAPVLEQYGTRFDPEVLAATVDHWGPRVNAQVHADLPVIGEVSYGEDARHRMDLFPVKGHGAPVVLFVHGGGFVAGDKRGTPPFYANVGRYFSAHGMLGACMNYRRAPTGGWPAAAQDLERAAAWLLERCDLYGGDPSRFVVIGQSAGACHVATWLFDEAFRAGARERVKSAVLMSGFYEAVAPLAPGPAAYFGDDVSRYAQRSPLTHVRALPHPVLVTQASHDPAYLRGQSQALAGALATQGAQVQSLVLEGHNHVSPLMTLGSDDDSVGLMLRRFVSQSTAPVAPVAVAA